MGRYQIETELGRGAMAAVYKAYDPQLNRHVALKVLHAERCANADLRRRFVREAKAAGKLRHGNIITVYDVGEENDRPYIAMELLDGEFLDATVRSGAPLDAERVVAIATQLAQALQVAHTAGVIHRDIKPANIVWLPREQQVRLTDFGIARVDDATQSEATQVGHIIGTPQYMSPEQITGRPVDARSDLFSLGVVLYQLASGKRPFSGENAAALTYQIAHQAVPPLRDVAPGVPPNFAHAVDRLLQKDPARRFKNAEEFLHALTAAPERPPMSAASRMVWKRIVPALAGSLMLAVIIVIATQPPVPVPDAPAPPDAAVSERARREAEINALFAGYSCAWLNAQLTSDSALSVRGVMRETDFPALMDALERVAHVDHVAYEVEALPWPHCEIAALLGDVRARPGLSLAATHPASFEIMTPTSASYVYADVYRADGRVTHLLPTNAGGAVAAPGSTMVVNAAGALDATDVDALVVVMALRAPLDGRRDGAQEAAQEYLTRVHRALQTEGMLIAAEYQRMSRTP